MITDCGNTIPYVRIEPKEEDMRKRCILIRHGKTPGNEEGRYTGCKTDDKLSAAGMQEVRAAADRVRSLFTDDPVIVCSPLKRAVQTAKLIFGDGDPKIIEDLKEMDFGSFEGKNYEELKDDPEYRAWIDSRGSRKCPGGEDIESFKDRSVSGFIKATNLCKDGRDCCIVCHGGNIMAILCRLNGGDYYDYRVDPIGGYILDTETDDEGIHIITYDRFDGGISS